MDSVLIDGYTVFRPLTKEKQNDHSGSKGRVYRFIWHGGNRGRRITRRNTKTKNIVGDNPLAKWRGELFPPKQRQASRERHKVNIDDQTLKQWLKLCIAADSAPWEPSLSSRRGDREKWAGRIEVGFPGTPEHSSWKIKASSQKKDIANIRFICMARTAVPLMVQEIIDLQETIVALRTERKTENATK